MNDKNRLLSVIVTVYNCENQIEKCLKSIINQTYKNLEIIIVNDGSTDNSKKIYECYAMIDRRIVVLEQENRGVISARILGAENANGEYLTFVDGDDWIEKEMYQNLMMHVEKKTYDMIISGLLLENEFESWNEIDLVEEGAYDKSGIQKKIIPFMMYEEYNERRAITSSLCNKICKKTLFEKQLAFIDPRVTYGEDALFVYPMIAMAKSIYVEKKAWYHYVTSQNSMVHSFTLESFGKIKLLQESLQRAFANIGIWNQMENQVKVYIRPFLYGAIESIYGLLIEKDYYNFPVSRVEKGSKVILYGAGKVGKSYYKWLMHSSYATVAGWVDRDWVRLNTGFYSIIEEPESIVNKQYDYVVVAVINKSMACEIISSLTALGIDKNLIIWENS